MAESEPGTARRWPVWRILLVGCLVISVVAWLRFRSEPTAPRTAVAPIAEAVTVRVTPKGHTYVLPRRLGSTEEPPRTATCDRASDWIRGHDGRHFRSAGLMLTIEAARLAQVAIRRISIHIERSTPIESGGNRFLFFCQAPKASKPDPFSAVPGAGDDLVHLPGDDHAFPMPRFTVGAEPGDTQGGVRAPGGGDFGLPDSRFDLLAGKAIELPIEVAGHDPNRTYWFSVIVELTVNGRESTHRLTEDGAPIAVEWALLMRGPAHYEWRPGADPPMRRNHGA